MHERSLAARQEAGSPSWRFWLRRDRWLLWEAVNLALDREPPPPPDASGPPPFCDEPVAELLALAITCEGVSLPVHRARPVEPGGRGLVLDAYVLAGDFARWLDGKGLELPEPMRQLLERPAEQTAAPATEPEASPAPAALAAPAAPAPKPRRGQLYPDEQAILRALYRSGVPLKLSVLCTDASVSETPARRALAALEELRLVLHLGERGGWSLTEPDGMARGLECHNREREPG